MQIIIWASTGINTEQVKEISKEWLIMKVASYLNTENKILVLYSRQIYSFTTDMYLLLDYGDLHTSVRYQLSDTSFEYKSTKKSRQALLHVFSLAHGQLLQFKKRYLCKDANGPWCLLPVSSLWTNPGRAPGNKFALE